MSRYFYIHVPKTGGTSIDAYFKNAFSERALTHCEHMVTEGKHAEISSHHYASGHVSYSTLLRSNITFDKLIVSYRDPFFQLSSHLRWLALIGQDTESAMFKNHPVPIQQIGLKINDTDFNRPDDVTSYVSTMSVPELGLFDNFLVRYLCPYAVGAKVGNQHCLAAFSTLNDVNYFIDTDTLHDDVADLFRKENIAQPEQPLHENSGRSHLTREQITSRREELAPLYRFDQILYEAIIKKRETSA